MSEPNSLAEWAEWYAGRGIAVFPLKPRSKQPATTHGFKDATTDLETIREMWTQRPDCNIGIACGAASGGLLVFDLDVGADVDGAETLRCWEAEHGELPETATAFTGSGGKHLFYRTGRADIHPSVNQDVGIDIRCDGSYVVAPPSVHPSGALYEWWASPEDVGFADANDRVYNLLGFVQPQGVAGGYDDNGEYRKFELPESIKAGGRNNVLYKYACQLRAKRMDEQQILETVAGANMLRCQPPLPQADIIQLVQSACTHKPGTSFENEGEDERRIGAPGAGLLQAAPEDFRGKRGGLATNKLGAWIIKSNHARLIDGAPAVWTGRSWTFGTDAIKRLALHYADDAKTQDKNEVVSYVMDKAPNVSSSAAFDGKAYVQFANCTWDVLGEQEVEPTPDMFIISSVDVDLDLNVGRNLADDFLESIAGGDASIQLVLREVIGACMVSSHVISQSPMLIGRADNGRGHAANGKSTFIKFVQTILGSSNYATMDIATLGQRFQAGQLLGKLANLGDDIPNEFLRGAELSTFKKLVTGDAIYTDVKNSTGFSFRPTATMVFSMNDIPRLADTTDGVFRRLAFVPFMQTFKPGSAGYDPYMEQKLAQPEVLKRGALLGLMALPELVRRGALTELPSMQAEVEEVRMANDSVATWLYETEENEVTLNGRVVEEVYSDYKHWCDEAGERNPCSRKSFTKRVVGYISGIESRSKKVGGHSVRAFQTA